MITFIVNTHKGRGGGICPLCPPYICHRDFSSSWLLDYQASLTNNLTKVRPLCDSVHRGLTLVRLVLLTVISSHIHSKKVS